MICLTRFTLGGLRRLYFSRSLAELAWVAGTELLSLACLALLSLRALLSLLGLRRLRLARSLAQLALLARLGRLLALLLACFFWFALLAYFDLLCFVDLRGSRG